MIFNDSVEDCPDGEFHVLQECACVAWYEYHLVYKSNR